MGILGERIHDDRFLRLIANLLQAGYLEDWRYGRTLSGTPQGGVVSPHPGQHLPRPVGPVCRRRPDPGRSPAVTNAEAQPGVRRLCAAQSRTGRTATATEAAAPRLRQQMTTLPSKNPDDPAYRRLRYVRYADDFLLGLRGTTEPKPRRSGSRLGAFLRDQLKLELSAGQDADHPRADGSRPLPRLRPRGPHAQRRPDAHDGSDGGRRRSTSGVIGLKVPADVMRDKCAPYQRARQTDPPRRATARRRVQHRRALRQRVSGRRGVLPAGFQPARPRPAASG